jgi:hypothetical protein
MPFQHGTTSNNVLRLPGDLRQDPRRSEGDVQQERTEAMAYQARLLEAGPPDREKGLHVKDAGIKTETVENVEQTKTAEADV